MANEAKMDIGGDAIGNVVTTGSGNQGEATVQYLNRQLPTPSRVDIRAELAEIRKILLNLNSQDPMKIQRALADAEDEAKKPRPDKDEIGDALNRAFVYAKKSAEFTDAIDKLAAHVCSAAAWLGTNWHVLLPFVGIAS